MCEILLWQTHDCKHAHVNELYTQAFKCLSHNKVLEFVQTNSRSVAVLQSYCKG